MNGPVPHTREAGAGATVLCLHSNASASAQWRGLMEVLAPRFRAVAPDLLGAGRSPAWPDDEPGRLACEIDLLAPVLAAAGPRFHLVGHSYGAALATRIAVQMPQRVASLVLYEPTLFVLLDEEQPGSAAAAGIRDAAAAAAAAVARGDLDGAGCAFIDFWLGAGAWHAMPAERRATVAASMRPMARWAHALFAETLKLADLAALRQPVLLLGGGTSPPAASEVLRLLRQALPRAESVVFPDLGHMGPVTHAGPVNQAIERFLLAQPPA